MKWLTCGFRLTSPGWCICRNERSEHPKKRVRPADCRVCRVRSEPKFSPVTFPVMPLPSDGVPAVPLPAPSETPQEPRTRLPEVTSLGTLIFQRTDWEPPPCPPGYHRADTETAWVLEPDIPMCEHLELGTGEIGSCGYPRLTRLCKLIESFVGPRTCVTCTKR
jgi:hypothetical protein